MRCPTCRRPVDPSDSNRWRPFCSERCRLIDLGEWVSEGHRIPGEPVDPATVGTSHRPDGDESSKD